MVTINSYFNNLTLLNTISFHDVGLIIREERILLHAHSVAGVLRVLFFFYYQPEARFFYDLHVCIASCSAILPLSGWSGTRPMTPPSSGKVL